MGGPEAGWTGIFGGERRCRGDKCQEGKEHDGRFGEGEDGRGDRTRI